MADTTSLTVVCQGVAGLDRTPTERGHEFLKVRQSIVRPRSRLGMILDGKQWQLAVTNAFDGAVVEVEVSHFEGGGSGDTLGTSNDGKTMVLGGDQHLIRPDTAHRVIAPPVAVREFGGRRSVGQSDQLMSQADAEGGKTGLRQFSNRPERVSHG